MSVPLYMDVHVRGEIRKGLIVREVDVMTAQEDGAERLPDDELLDRATALGRPMFSQDADLLAEAVARQRAGEHFSGVIYAHQLKITIGEAIEQLELLTKVMDQEEFADRVFYLPLK
jgi:hypothetical protein